MVSNALLMSRLTITVLDGGLFLLKPWIMLSVISWIAVVVECFCLKPCWCSICGMFKVMYGSIDFSKVLAID